MEESWKNRGRIVKKRTAKYSTKLLKDAISKHFYLPANIRSLHASLHEILFPPPGRGGGPNKGPKDQKPEGLHDERRRDRETERSNLLMIMMMMVRLRAGFEVKLFKWTTLIAVHGFYI